MLRPFISLAIVTLVLACGSASFAGPTGWAHKDNVASHPWLSGYPHATNSYAPRRTPSATYTYRRAPVTTRYNVRRESGYLRWNDARGVQYLQDGLNRTFYWNGSAWTYTGH